jgi:hypothetical protein
MERTVPVHMYKDAVANELEKKPYVISLRIAYILIEKYIESYKFCLGKDVSHYDCANDIYYEWQNHVRNQPEIKHISPINKKICCGVKLF